MIAGNWKMNLDFNEAMALIAELVDNEQHQPQDLVDVLIFPPAFYTRHAYEFLRNARSVIHLGVQDVASFDNGAYTGALSAKMAKVAGATHALIGHSERRSFFNEDGAVLLKKTQYALTEGLHVVFCCGESLQDRKASQHFKTVEQQLDEVLGRLASVVSTQYSIAYEPVWAIGTGETATPQQAQEMHAFIRAWVSSKKGAEHANGIRILYGGSMKPENAAELLAQADVDGGLIGGASLKSDDFSAIIHA